MGTGDSVVILGNRSTTFPILAPHLVYGMIGGAMRVQRGASLSHLDSLATPKGTEMHPSVPKT